MRPSWHEDAVKEFCESAAYFERKSEGLGERFIREAESTIARIMDDPMSLRDFSHGCKRMNLRRFPYAVIYTMRGDSVHIVAVMGQARKPGYWLKREK